VKSEFERLGIRYGSKGGKPDDVGKEDPDPAAVPEDAGERQELLDAAWARCKTIAADPIRQLLDIARRLGIIGDKRGVVAVFLMMVSRLLGNPGSLLRKGASSSGKSFPIDNLVPNLFTKEIDYIEMTAASGKSMPYDKRSYRHRAVIIGEGTALAPGKYGDESFVGMIREILSKGRIIYQTVMKTGGKNAELRTVIIEKPGPIVIITTAAREIVEEEMNTRMLSSLADETPAQSKAVVEAKGAQLQGTAPPRPDEAELAAWRAFQDWLRFGPREVVVPFAGKLSTLVDTKSLRVRRDFSTFGALIQASALVNRANREIDTKGRIVAELEDYGLVLLALDSGLDEIRFGNVDQLNQIRQVVVDLLDQRQREWRRVQTLRQTNASLVTHCNQMRIKGVAKRLNAAYAAAGEGHGSFARYRDTMTNNGQDPTWGGLAATKAAVDQMVRHALMTSARTTWGTLSAPKLPFSGNDPVPRTVELSYAKLAELLGVTYKVARTRLALACEAAAVIEHEEPGRAKTAPRLLAPGKVVIATRAGRGRGAFPSLAELQAALLTP
jgi:hypothetical protein